MTNLCLAIGSMMVLVGSSATVNSYNNVNEVLLVENYRPNGRLVKLELARTKGKNVKSKLPTGAKYLNGYWQYTPILNAYAKVTLDYLPSIKSYSICNQHICKSLPEIFPNIKMNQTVELLVCQ